MYQPSRGGGGGPAGHAPAGGIWHDMCCADVRGINDKVKGGGRGRQDGQAGGSTQLEHVFPSETSQMCRPAHMGLALSLNIEFSKASWANAEELLYFSPQQVKMSNKSNMASTLANA